MASIIMAKLTSVVAEMESTSTNNFDDVPAIVRNPFVDRLALFRDCLSAAGRVLQDDGDGSLPLNDVKAARFACGHSQNESTYQRSKDMTKCCKTCTEGSGRPLSGQSHNAVARYMTIIKQTHTPANLGSPSSTCTLTVSCSLRDCRSTKVRAFWQALAKDIAAAKKQQALVMSMMDTISKAS